MGYQVLCTICGIQLGGAASATVMLPLATDAFISPVLSRPSASLASTFGNVEAPQVWA